MLSPLDRKLLRDLRAMTGQVLTISLVVACGIGAFVATRATYASLRESQAAYYERYRFGDVFARLERAPNAIAGQVEALPGVAVAYPRIVDTIRLPMPNLSEPAIGMAISLPAHGRAALNDVHLAAGRMPEPGRQDEILLLASFAEAHELGIGDSIQAIVNGSHRELGIVGTAMSPELVIAISGGEMAPDPEKFAAIWMNEGVLAAAFDMEGAFNDLVIRMQPNASEEELRLQLDRLLEPYGGFGSIGRSRQLSHFMLEQELGELENMSTWAPAIFLFVAAFLFNLVLSRIVTLQRAQIATLKAIGYGNAAISAHFLKLAAGIVLFGALLGAALGQWLGREMTELYARFFHFPLLRFEVDSGVLLTAVLVSLAAGLLGALGSARKVFALAPAEAMRPAAPMSYRRGLIERVGFLWDAVGPATRMILREVRRRPLRLILSALGIALAVGILVVGRFFYDAMEYLVEDYLHEMMREDVSVMFAGSIPRREERVLASLPGVLHVESARAVPVRISAGHREREAVIYGYVDEPTLRRPIDRDLRAVPVPSEGVLLTSTLAEILEVEAGDSVRLELREGERPHREIAVAGTIDELYGLQGHMRLDGLNALLRQRSRISMTMLRIDPNEYEGLRGRLEAMPRVSFVIRKASMLELFREHSGENVRVFTLILTLFASVIAIGVVYNNARISLSMRSRDLASLRVLGFTRGEISAILLGELALQVGLAIPLGLWIGTVMASGLLSQVDPEVYRLPVIISTRTYIFAAVVTLWAALVSALLVRRKLDALDLIAVLKTRE
ncbi:MAG: ABC transporter permease [Myxococcales bacterium]|nr:ABC transporter permease [Myxococcales bacterium]